VPVAVGSRGWSPGATGTRKASRAVGGLVSGFHTAKVRTMPTRRVDAPTCCTSTAMPCGPNASGAVDSWVAFPFIVTVNAWFWPGASGPASGWNSCRVPLLGSRAGRAAHAASSLRVVNACGVSRRLTCRSSSTVRPALCRTPVTVSALRGSSCTGLMLVRVTVTGSGCSARTVAGWPVIRLVPGVVARAAPAGSATSAARTTSVTTAGRRLTRCPPTGRRPPGRSVARSGRPAGRPAPATAPRRRRSPPGRGPRRR